MSRFFPTQTCSGRLDYIGLVSIPYGEETRRCNCGRDERLLAKDVRSCRRCGRRRALVILWAKHASNARCSLSGRLSRKENTALLENMLD